MPLSVSEMRDMAHRLFDGEIDARELLDRLAPGQRQLGLFRRGPSHGTEKALTAAHRDSEGTDGPRGV